jgi:hypothetical protein
MASLLFRRGAFFLQNWHGFFYINDINMIKKENIEKVGTIFSHIKENKLTTIHNILNGLRPSSSFYNLPQLHTPVCQDHREGTWKELL